MLNMLNKENFGTFITLVKMIIKVSLSFSIIIKQLMLRSREEESKKKKTLKITSSNAPFLIATS